MINKKVKFLALRSPFSAEVIHRFKKRFCMIGGATIVILSK